MSKADLMASTPPDYLTTFSLKCEPFANDLDGRFFYGGTALMQRLDLLTHLTQFGDSVILVSGPPGSGKTTLLGRFAAQSNKQWRLCLINANEFEQFQQRLADTLRVGESTDELQLLEQWVSQTDNSQLLVIVIDNAEELPESAFEKLCTLLNQPFAERIRLTLFGTPEAQQTLKRSLDQKNLSCTTQLLEVPRLSEEETASYLMYRLAVAGYSGESPFTATEVRGICKAADGRPAAINQLAHDSLFELQARNKSKRLKPGKPGRKIGAAVWVPASVLVMGAALYVGWERLQPALQPPGGQESQAQVSEPLPLDLPPPAATLATVDAEKPLEAAEKSAAPIPEAPMEAEQTGDIEAPESPAPVAVITPAPTPSPALTTPEKVPETDTAPVPDTAGVMAAAPAEHPVTASPSEPAPPPAEPEPAVVVVESPTVQPDTRVPATAPQKTVVEAGSQPVSEPQPPAAHSDGPHREDWLLQQDENAFSLQLLGSRSEKSIRDYIKRHKFDLDTVAYYRGSFRGKDWYVLIFGVYPDKAAALTARDALPKKVRTDKPWPRSFKSVQSAIREMQ